MFCCPKTWLWFRREGSPQQASKREVLLVPVGQGLGLEDQPLLLVTGEEELVLGLDQEMLLLPCVWVQVELRWALLVLDQAWGSLLSLGQLEGPQGLHPLLEPWVRLGYNRTL